MKKLILDFVITETATSATSQPNGHATPAAVKAQPMAATNGLPKCSCGSDTYVLASEMTADRIKGIPASRMYECINCGTYRLG